MLVQYLLLDLNICLNLRNSFTKRIKSTCLCSVFLCYLGMACKLMETQLGHPFMEEVGDHASHLIPIIEFKKELET